MNERHTEANRAGAFWLFAVLHLFCCGLPLLLLSGVSLATLWAQWPWLAGALALVGVIGFAWYLKRGCATCPRNESCAVAKDGRGHEKDAL